MPGYEASAVTGIGVPVQTPQPIVERLNQEINAGLADPALRQRFTDGGGIILAGTPADFGKLLEAETAKWAKVIKSSGAKP